MENRMMNGFMYNLMRLFSVLPIPYWHRYFVHRKCLYLGSDNEIWLTSGQDRIRCGFWTMPPRIMVRIGNRHCCGNRLELEVPSLKSSEVKRYFSRQFKETMISFSSSGAVVKIGMTSKPIRPEFHIDAGLNARVEIGRDFCTSPNVKIEATGCCAPGGTPAKITIGDGVLVASGTLISNNDHHVILDTEHHGVVNWPRDIVIGNHVWLCTDAVVLKGSGIPDQSILGLRSICTGHFDQPNCVLAGNPARVVRQHVTWDYPWLEKYQKLQETANQSVK